MNVLVTGASGFLGTRVVAALVRRECRVTALVRPSRPDPAALFPDGVRIARGDLRLPASLAEALEGIEAVVHLAACVTGDDDAQFANTVLGTEHLLDAMVRQHVQRLVHCSTFSVYDWHRAPRTLDEEAPLEANLYTRDGYAISKTWQERLVRRYAAQHQWQLTVLRPGFLWGPGGDALAGVGPSVGPLHVTFGWRRQLPLSHVDNCADCFAAALLAPQAVGQTYNVVDDPPRGTAHYLRHQLRADGRKGLRVYVPYWCGLAAAEAASLVSRLLFRRGGKLPSLLVPSRYRARFRPVKFTNDKLRTQLGWRPPLAGEQAWEIRR